MINLIKGDFMINLEMRKLGAERSKIRELYEYGKELSEKVGKENVFDFTLGNPSVPCPKKVTDDLAKLLLQKKDVHAYTSAQGDYLTRKSITDYNAKKYGFSLEPNLIYMTCGAAASIRITLSAIIDTDDQIIVLAPFFPEYKVFIQSAGAKTIIVPPSHDMGLDFDSIEKSITKNTKAIIINSPNNPSGRVYDENEIKKLAEILNEKQKKFQTEIYLITDEPYREILFDNTSCPFIPKYYSNTIICYSYSKALSLPGERIGYIAVSPKCKDCNDVFLSICGAGRSLGYVCAPSLFQHLIALDADCLSNLTTYEENRNVLIKILTELNFECINPKGAFYLFVKSPIESAEEFSQKAKKFGILIVPSESFGVNSYVRIATCVDKDTIIRSKNAFELLAKSIGII